MRPKKNTPKPKTKPARAPNDAENSGDRAFQSPEPDNETDYGLDFTTSRLAELNTSRRCSTLRKQPSNAARDDDTSDENDDDIENQDPAETTAPRRSSNRMSEQAASSQSTVAPAPRQRKNQPQATASGPAARRKQTKPEHRLRKLNREIERLQHSAGYLIPRLSFSRVVREVMMERCEVPFMITIGALEAIQTATEMYLTQRFEDAYLLTKYRGRVTLEVRDMAMVGYFCRTYGNL